MIANYHTHTWRCKHAVGTEREYVERAIAGGLASLGFSDHTPMPFADGYVSPVKMDMEQLEDYVDTVLALRSEYRRDIDILLGLEVEYYPRYWEELLRVTGEYPFDYFILGQHFLGNEPEGDFCGHPSDSEEDLLRYVRQSVTALETGAFTYFAHPDVYNFTGNPKLYDQAMRELCESAKRLDIPLEINLLGEATGRHYPNPRFWKIAGEVGNTAILGSDAHEPEAVYRPEAIRMGETIAADNHLTLLQSIRPVRPVLRNELL